MPEINIGGYVPQRTPFKRNIAAFSQALDKIDEKAKESLERQNQIQMALANLDINPAESEWQAAYARNIQNQLDEAATYGDYSRSLTTARMLAGQVASDPAVIGRVKSQAAYKNYMDNLDKRNDITQDVKDWAKAQNPYHYEDRIDNNGNVIQGTQWEPNKTPVSTVPLSSLLDKAKQWAAVHKGGGMTDVKFVDADGNLTSDYSKGIYGLAYQKNGTWERLDEKDLRDAFKSALDTTPGARASIQQDYDVALWKYNNMSDEDKRNNIDSDITDDKGAILTPEAYLEKKISPGIHSMTFNNVTSTTEYGDAMNEFRKDIAARASASVSQQEQNQFNLDAANDGDIIEVDGNKIMASHKAGLDSAIVNLQKLFPNLSRSNAFNKLLKSQDYNGLANLCKAYITSKDKNIVSQARHAINDVRNLGRQYNAWTKGLNSDSRQAVEFNAAIESGSILPSNNIYTTQYNNKVNSLFKDNINGEMGYRCQSGEAYREILAKLGCSSDADLRAKGFRHLNIDGNDVIAFNRNNNYISKLADAVDSSRGFFGKLAGGVGMLFGGGSGLIWTNNNKPIQAPMSTFYQLGRTSASFLDSAEMTPVREAANKAIQINAFKGINKKYVTNKLYNTTLDRQRLLNDLNTGRINKETYETNLKALEENEKSLVNTSFLINAKLYKDGVPIPEDEKAEYIDAITNAYTADALNINVGRNHGLAQTVTEYNILSKGKDGKASTITMIGANGSRYLKSFEQNTSTLARDEAVQMALTGSSKTLPNGTVISRVNNDGGYINGKRYNSSVIENVLRTELNRQQIAEHIASGIDEMTAKAMIAACLNEAGKPVDNLHISQEYKYITQNY